MSGAKMPSGIYLTQGSICFLSQNLHIPLVIKKTRGYLPTGITAQQKK